MKAMVGDSSYEDINLILKFKGKRPIPYVCVPPHAAMRQAQLNINKTYCGRLIAKCFNHFLPFIHHLYNVTFQLL